MKTSEGEKSVPITWAYNHHYVSYITSSFSEMTQVTTDEIGILPLGGYNHGASKMWMMVPKKDTSDPRPDSRVPIFQFFAEGNGGEFR